MRQLSETKKNMNAALEQTTPMEIERPAGITETIATQILEKSQVTSCDEFFSLFKR